MRDSVHAGICGLRQLTYMTDFMGSKEKKRFAVTWKPRRRVFAALLSSQVQICFLVPSAFMPFPEGTEVSDFIM